MIFFIANFSAIWVYKGILKQGRNWVILSGGREYICSRKDEIIHGLSPSVICVASLLETCP